MQVRGIRGATTIEEDTRENILAATEELLLAILKKNIGLKKEDIASVIFTVTEDLSAIFPPLAAREMGWSLVPMICAREIPVPNSTPKCIRVLLHWNTEKQQNEIKHIFLHRAKNLRPDLVEEEE